MLIKAFKRKSLKSHTDPHGLSARKHDAFKSYRQQQRPSSRDWTTRNHTTSPNNQPQTQICARRGGQFECRCYWSTIPGDKRKDTENGKAAHPVSAIIEVAALGNYTNTRLAWLGVALLTPSISHCNSQC